ncbi:bL21 family ribosomal protein [Candidatus Vidania fulgoroideorum]
MKKIKQLEFMKKKKLLAVIEYRNRQFLVKENFFIFESNLIKENIININKVILIKYNEKIYIGKPYLNNIKLIFSFCYLNKYKKKIIKFKRRKRYKIIKSFSSYKYLAVLELIKWQKKKQLVL